MRLMLVDANNLIMRAAFATDRVNLSVDGIPTATLMVFVNLLSRHIRSEEPTHLVLCWDGGKSAFRTGMYPLYKAQRGVRVDNPDGHGPFVQAKEFADLAGIQQTERIGWEADDLIACYWQNTRRDHPDTEVVILSSDKDLLQLVDPMTTVIRPVSTPQIDRWDEFRVSVHFGVPPEHLSKAMALMGDLSDNIPGVHGLGPKKAASILLDAEYDLTKAMSTRSVVDQGLAELSYALINLRTMDYASHGLGLATPPRFQPAPAGGSLSDFLDRYKLGNIASRLEAQTLWHESEHSR